MSPFAGSRSVVTTFMQTHATVRVPPYDNRGHHFCAQLIDASAPSDGVAPTKSNSDNVLAHLVVAANGGRRLTRTQDGARRGASGNVATARGAGGDVGGAVFAVHPAVQQADGVRILLTEKSY